MKFEDIQDKLIGRMVKTKGNEEWLAECPHKKIADLSMVYAVAVVNEKKIQLDTVSSKSVLTMQMTDKEFMEKADKAVNKNNSYQIRPLISVIREMEGTGSYEYKEPSHFPLVEKGTESEPYLITNRRNFMGASVMGNPAVMEKTSGLLGGDFYIIPSSIHEVLAIKVDPIYTSTSLQDMVRDVNDTEVNVEDRLSDNVYVYDSMERTIETVDDYEMRNQIGMKHQYWDNNREANQDQNKERRRDDDMDF